jgi:integrative and conjugative element protein (TIGR02256 family)
VVADRDFIDKLICLRKAELPAETGGVLLGVWDVIHHIVYMVDTIPAPPDSKKRTTSFVRGCEGLLTKVKQAGVATGGMVQYVGEWHSHPDGYDTHTSEDDRSVLAWIAEKTQEDGYQPVMGIIGEHDQRWFIEAIELDKSIA